ncbi:MAG: methyltransferase [Bacteroidia bacterium]|nr:methyltransferase [Bacteroidia bacterium]
MLLKNLLFHKYPQNIWAKNIILILRELNLENDTAIVDAPCGNGIIAYFVKKAFPNRNVYALDLSVNQLNSPYLKSPDVKINIKQADVFNEKIKGENNIWLLINSLYCLPDKYLLIENNRSQYKYILALVPDVDSDNFSFFTKQNPNFQNPSKMTLNETIQFFHDTGYELINTVKTTMISFHKWNEKLVKFKIPFTLRNFIFFLLNKLSFFGKPKYHILVLKRI